MVENNKPSRWRTPISIIPSKWKVDKVTTPNGVFSWDEILQKDPEYLIDTDIAGRPFTETYGGEVKPQEMDAPDITHSNLPTPELLYRFHDFIASRNPASPYNAAVGWIGGNASLAGLAAGGITAPWLTSLGIVGDIGGQYVGNKTASIFFNNPDKPFKINHDISLTPKDTMLLGIGAASSIVFPAIAHKLYYSPLDFLFSKIQIDSSKIPSTSQMRLRLGDLEINDPNLNYRQELSENDWNLVVTTVLNRPFVEAYNLWNRFGYPEVPKGIISDTPKLESFVRGLLNRHNTFSRGVLVIPSEKTALEQLLGRRLSDDEFLRVAATTPRKEGDVGQAGLWISPRTDYTSIYGGGKTALVRRPFKLGPDRMLWFKEASFNVQHNPGGEGLFTDIMAPWNSKPVLNWDGIPKYSTSTIPESELLSPTRMDFVEFIKGSPHMNYRTSLNSNPFFTKGQNHFDRESRQWIIDTYKNGGKLNGTT